MIWLILTVLWVFSGIVGSRIIVNLWFSGVLRDLRPENLDLGYVVIGVIYGPFNLLIAGMFWAVGIGRK